MNITIVFFNQVPYLCKIGYTYNTNFIFRIYCRLYHVTPNTERGLQAASKPRASPWLNLVKCSLVLTETTLNVGVTYEPFWTPTHRSVLTNVTECTGPTCVIEEAGVNAVLVEAGLRVATLIVSGAVWLRLNNKWWN